MNYNELWHLLAQRYDEGEAKAIARMTYEVRFGLTFSDLCLGKDTQLSADDQTELEEIAQRLSKGEPIQYVLGQAEFCGRTFLVNEAVLIPRPETEELCRWIAESEKRKVISDKCSILDIGTGSGCIAITLAAEMLGAGVTAWDISKDALEVARENAKRTGVHVSFEQVDALHLTSDILHQTSGVFDLIVSNPPYIPTGDIPALDVSVRGYEPHLALDGGADGLAFYRSIIGAWRGALRPYGKLLFEVGIGQADDVRRMLADNGLRDIQVIDDLNGVPRVVCGTLWEKDGTA